ncbi:Imm1 family immunity protein [Saccharopolyspora sp. CA-218241]|uniref:Imm1 family immunity protein n=1 Tax=Saccharopolyspora sp. CA-218241 TaxID=3240027 RepID=UPI003D989DA0
MVTWSTRSTPTPTSPRRCCCSTTRGGLLFPRSASLPLEQVRDAVAEFCRTGARPTCVRWQPGEWS